MLTSFSSSPHSHVFLFSLLLLLVDFDFGEDFFVITRARIRHTKKDTRFFTKYSIKFMTYEDLALIFQVSVAPSFILVTLSNQTEELLPKMPLVK